MEEKETIKNTMRSAETLDPLLMVVFTRQDMFGFL